MPDENNILKNEAELVRELQLTIRRQLDLRGKSLKQAAYDSGISYSTLCTYFPNERNAVPAALGVAALRRLLRALPSDLVSLLLPDGYAIVRVPEGIDHDAAAEAMADYLAAKQAAHREDSEAGRDIGPNENSTLNGKLAVVRAA